MQQDEMLEVVKALGNAERLRVVGQLTQSPSTISQVVEALGIPFKDAMNHLSYLEYVGVARVTQKGERRQEDVFALNPEGLAKLAEARLNAPRAFEPDASLDEQSRKVLKNHLNADGSIRQIPVQKPAKLQVILDYLIQAFSVGVIYTEKEVNQVLGRYHEDTAGLRRDLVDRGMLERKSDGSQYWRPAPQTGVPHA